MNKSDAERIEAVMEKAGYSPTSLEKEASVIIAVACSVRQSPIDRIYGLSGRWVKLKAKNPELATVLTGCVLGLDKKKLDGRFDLVIPIADINKLVQMQNAECRMQNFDVGRCDYLSISPKRQSKHQAYVPIMTGCDNYCSYCVVPYVRGRETFRDKKEVLAEVRDLLEKGYREITLLGENVNAYPKFPTLLKNIAQIPGKFWIRFVTSHPEDFTRELIEVIVEEKKICNYIHLPVQSGSTAVLKKMNRKYTKSEYLKLISKIKKAIPDTSLSTDIIVGFPGETKKQFDESADVMKKVKFDMAYVAQYSPRPGTAAAKMEDDVTREDKKRRERVLTQILRETSLENNRGLIGETVEVLVESGIRNQELGSGLIGKTEHFKNVRFKGDKKLVGEFVKVKITKASEFGLEGKL